MAAIPGTGKKSGGHVYHWSGSGLRGDVIAYFASRVDHREDPMIPAMKPMESDRLLSLIGYGECMRGRLYRDRKALRLERRRKSRRLREVARWMSTAGFVS